MAKSHLNSALSAQLGVKEKMSQHLNIFLSQAKQRSNENEKSFKLLVDNECYGVAIGLLRQELDTLIRLCYLWSPETTNDVANSLIEKSVNGEQWRVVNHNGKSVKVFERDMLDLSSSLGGWENVIYSFGCKLIHLTDYHLYKTEDPFTKIEEIDKKEISNT